MRLLAIFLFSILVACSGNDAPAHQRDTLQPHVTDSSRSLVDTVSNEAMDSVQLLDTTLHDSIKKWSTTDFIISKKHKSSTPLRNLIEHTREEWKNVPNPFTAVYRGCDLVDYFHLNFEDTLGKSHDFGFGENNLGSFKLFNGDNFRDNPKYLNKTFIVYWDWKPSKFPCCDGDYENVEAYYPSIIKLELQKN